MTTTTPQASFVTALECFSGGDLRGARENCERILTRAPGDVPALILLGLCYTREGRLLKGEEYVRRALALDPSNQDGQRVLAEIALVRDSVKEYPYVRDYLLNLSRYRDYPRNVGLETVGRCNAACNFCPQPDLERRTETMSDQLFAKIIGDLREIPEDHPFNIFPNLVNEPFMDRQIFDRLGIINAELPQASLHIFTNMNVMHRDFAERIAVIRNISGFNVSFNAANRVEYERVMRIDFERTVRNLRDFMALNRKHRILPGPVVLSRIMDHTPSDAAYVSGCEELFPEFTPGDDYVTNVKHRTDWLGRVGTNSSPVPYPFPCGAWFDINIFCTGVVPHCCMDAHGDYSVGDVNRSSVLEIYNSPAFRQYRETLTSREQTHPCNTCSLLQ